MTGLFRSAGMTLSQIYVPSDCAYASMAALGELGLVQFKDMNEGISSFQRKFVAQVRRCDELERILKVVESAAKQENLKITPDMLNPEAPSSKEISEIQHSLEHIERDLATIGASQEGLRTNLHELLELKSVLKGAEIFLTEDRPNENSLSMEEFVLDSRNLGFTMGLIRSEKFPSFERLVWRSSRGNIMLRATDAEQFEEFSAEDASIKQSNKVFIAYYRGDALKNRFSKICEGFRAKTFDLPSNSDKRFEMSLKVSNQLEDLKLVLNKLHESKAHLLQSVTGKLNTWFIRIVKMKAIYHTLNMLSVNVTENTLFGEFWAPTVKLQEIRSALKSASELNGHTVEPVVMPLKTDEKPPTYFKVNKFTSGFQGIVDAYGVATYQEVNPALFTIISFPFMFAIMFGDFGHGVVMFLFALIFVLREKAIEKAKIKDEIFSTFFNGRYIILLMGIFAMYTGLIYNEVFSRSFNVFGSSWRNNYDIAHVSKEERLMLFPDSSSWTGYPYSIGSDPVWQFAENRLLSTNSYKMKMSVIFGIFHMMFGVILGAFNHVYFKQPINFVCEFVPMFLFLTSIFFYLCVVIFYKWTTFGAVGYGEYPGSNCAPSLLIGLINMVMFKTREPLTKAGGPDCSLYSYYNGQDSLEHFLVILAALCVPWMLIVKPVYLHKKHQKEQKTIELSRNASTAALTVYQVQHTNPSFVRNDSDTELHSLEERVFDTLAANSESSHTSDDSSQHSFGDLFIHQAIHTIEFCLGCISHTASYLRLWALSLAHSELTIVLWDMVLRQGISMKGYAGCVGVYIIFAAFAALTVAILIVMEGLSAFLHALRLHW